MKPKNITSKLAWRNVWRNKRRTLLTLLTIMVGCAMIIFMNAIGKGGHDQMIEDAVALNAGHIQIHEKGFWENQTLDYAFEPSSELLDRLGNDSRIAAFAERVMTGGLLSFGDNTRGMLIQGVDPEHEKQVSNLHTKIMPGGRFLTPEDTTHAVIGETLAKNTGVRIGDQIAMISQGFDGSIAAERFTVVGRFRSGTPDYDRELILIPLTQAKETFTMMGFIHSIAIRLDDASYLPQVRESLLSLTSRDETQLEVMGWDELMPELVQFIVMDDISAYIFIFILFMIVAFGVLNTIQMSVFERTREFGVMLSIGTLPGQITSMILLESVIISIIGIIFGIILGYGISLYFQINPMDYSSYAKEMAVWGVATTIFPAKTTSLNIIVTSILTFVLAVLFSVFPARRAAKLNPVEAIRKL
ncbi:ABC transporter permease [Desulfobacterales bacterium HSG2]|nr:ABC transporter permease [Desulfobacterales bacterium HSG2]